MLSFDFMLILDSKVVPVKKLILGHICIKA